MFVRSMIMLIVSILCLPTTACVAPKPAMDTMDTHRAEYEATAKELRKLAQEGDVTAQNGLALLYKVGRGVPQSYGQAKRWFEEAAKQGHPEAQVNLAALYLHGDAPPQSAQMALFWFTRAAEQGHVMAFASLGDMYAQGQGVPQNVIQAYTWFLLAARNGDETSADRRDRLAMKMTPAQIAEAQERAQGWKPTSKSVAWKATAFSNAALTDTSAP